MKLRQFHRLLAIIAAIFAFGLSSFPSVVNASPFGQGVFGADVPFGSATSITVSLGSNVSLNLSPSGGNLSGNGSHTISVTSTDVVGYRIYVHTLGTTNMVSAGGATIPASSNTSDAPLSASSWGYNTTGSTTNFIGMLATNSIIRDADGPYKSGDNTTVTYGALTASSQTAGAYSISVVYTVVAKNQ